MTSVIILSAILLLVVGINYGCTKMVRNSPDIISGFKLSEEPEQREKDLAWVEQTCRYMNIANIVTLVGGAIGLISGQHIVYFLFLILPICVAALLAYSRRTTDRPDGKTTVAVVSIMAAIIITCVHLLYIYQSDLKVEFADNRMEISGLYGCDIPLCDIEKAELRLSLPETSIRTNGFALGATNVGHFRTKTGKEIILFTHSEKYFIRLTLNDGTIYYLSHKDRPSTEQLFLTIQQYIRKR